MDPKKIVIVAKKSPQCITFCPKFKFGIFTIYLNRIWNLSSIISHLQAKLKRDLFFYPYFPFINLMMCTCFYYIYHRIPKNTSIELKVGQNVCFRVSFEFTKYQVILGNFARFTGKIMNLHGCYVKHVKTVIARRQKTPMGSMVDPPSVLWGLKCKFPIKLIWILYN